MIELKFSWRHSGNMEIQNLSYIFIKQRYYGKCSKISNPFLFLLLNKMLVISVEIHKNACQPSKQGDPDQTASSVCSGSALFVYTFL